MNFEPTDEQKHIRELSEKAAKQFLKSAQDADEEAGIFQTKIISELGKLGLTGIPTSEEFGGAGLGYQEYVVAIEEFAKVSAAYAISVSVSGLPQIILKQFGTDAQKKKYIPPLAAGIHIGAFALTEPGSGSDAGALRTTAKKDGNFYILNGTKLYITQGNIADTLILFARTGGEGAKGISAFILEKNTPGFKSGKKEHKMGFNISPTCELILENVKIPAENLVGREGQGFKIAMSALDSGRITIGAVAVGIAQAAFETSVKYSGERKQFGQEIRHFQGIQFILADMYTHLSSAKLLVSRAAFLRDKGLPYTIEASAAKLFATDACMKITTDAVQILGGNGYSKEFPVERFMREAKVLQILEGSNQIQRIVIGKALKWD